MNINKKQIIGPIPLIQKNKYSNRFSLIRILCPCLYTHDIDSSNQRNKYKQKSKNNNSFKRQNYLEEETINNQQFQNQQTEANLPQNQQFTQNNLKIQLQKENQLKSKKNSSFNFNQNLNDNPNNKNNIQSRNQQNKISENQNQKGNQKVKIVTFNVKRPNNLEGYLKEDIKNFKQQQKNMCKRNQVIRSQIVCPSTKCNTSSDQSHKKNVRVQKNLIQKSLNQQNNKKYKINSQKSKILQKYKNINLQQIIQIQKHILKMQGYNDYQFLHDWQQSYENNYPISKLRQNKLIILGNKNSKLLVKVKSVKLYPSSAALQKYKQSMRNQKKNKNKLNEDKSIQNNTIDRYWDKRYFLFQKFDQGIKLDQQSWYSVTPQAVADYLSTKITVQNTILDAFCGAGGDTLKLSTSCKQIIANDIDQVKIKCLINNAKVYDVNNIKISCMDYFSLNYKDYKVDAVYLAPPWGGPDYHKIQSFHPEQFEPKLSQIIQKAFSLSKNIFFLLPANTDIEALSALICQKVRNPTNYIFIPESCSLKIQKIFYNQRLKFIAVYFGTHEFQDDVKITQQLSYLYDMLKDQNIDNGIFKHKKLIRKLRQNYGMVNLLNWLFQCESYDTNLNIPTRNNVENWNNTSCSLTMIQKFQALIKSKKLLSQKQLTKIKQEQQIQFEYQLKNRQQRIKKNKNKKIQKHINKQKQRQNKQIRYSDQNHMKINILQNYHKNYQQMNEQQLQDDLIDSKQIDKIKYNRRNINKQVNISLNQSQNNGTVLNLNSQIMRSDSQNNRKTMRTISILSQFHQDQLKHIMNERNNINHSQSSSVSILDSIHPIRKLDSLDISFQESYQQFPQFLQNNQKIQSSVHRLDKNQQNNIDAFNRHSSPLFLSPSKQKIVKMKKNKNNSQWEKGIIGKINQEKQIDN